MSKILTFLKKRAGSIIGFFGGVSIIFGIIGFMFLENNIANAVYKTIQLFVLESGAVECPVNIWLQIARFTAPFTTAYAAILGLLVVFRNQLHYFLAGMKKNHIVICGLGEKGLMLVKRYIKKKEKVLVIELDEENDYIDTCRNLGAILLLGDATENNILRKAKIQKAKRIFAVCGTDSQNISVAAKIRKIYKNSPEKYSRVFVNILDFVLCRQLMYKEMISVDTQKQNIEFFNIYDHGSANWLEEYTRDKLYATNKNTHLMIFGIGQMGESLLLSIVQKWYNLKHNRVKNLTITIADSKAREIVNNLKEKYSILDSIQLKGNKIEFNSIKNNFFRGQSIDDIYITYESDQKALSAAITISNILLNNKRDIRIVAKIDRISDLKELFKTGYNKVLNENINIFGPLEETLKPERIVEKGMWLQLGKIIHESYLDFTKEIADGFRFNDKWKELDEETKLSNINQGCHIQNKMEKIGFKIVPLVSWNDLEVQFDQDQKTFRDDELETIAKMEHYRWNKELIENNWTYNKNRNNNKKQHDSLVKWDIDDSPEEIKDLLDWDKNETNKTFNILPSNKELPDFEKEKDREFCRKIPSFLHQMGYQVVRLDRTLDT